MAGKRHRWRGARRLDGTRIEDQFICACGTQRWPSIFKDWYYRLPDGTSFSLYKDETQPPCPGRPEEKRP